MIKFWVGIAAETETKAKVVKILKQYKFINAWPESIAAIDLSTAATTELETFDVAFRYQHFLSSTVEEQGASFEVSASITATI